jgi:peptidyl-prolyl cis-trans isomerase B (cyclophilin B)
MPDRRRTRERQLRKLYERRQAERRRKQRQRILTLSISGLLVVGLIVGLFLALTNNKQPSAAATPHTSPSTTPTVAPVACGGTVPTAASQQKSSYPKAPKMTIDPKKSYRATILTSCGTLVIDLDPKQSPNAVNSFVFLVKQRFFDGLIFHRIAKDFVIQGGDPTGTGSGGPGYKTVDTPPKDAAYPQGTVAMAKAGNEPAGTAGSQFFVVTGSGGNSLTPDYAIIGKLVAGLAVAKKIEGLPIVGGATDGKPTETVYILSVTLKIT